MITTIIRWFQWLLQARWLWTNVQIATLQHYRELILQKERYQNVKRLNQFEYQVFSQNGEDGILAEIFKRVEETNRVFVEIGAGNGLENNTTFLLQKGWSGYWLEGNPSSTRFIQKHFEQVINAGTLKIEQVFVRADNVGKVINNLQVPNEVDLLSIDIDRNTYYILDELLTQMKPRVIVVEYSAMYPPPVEWKVVYSPEKTWKRTSYAGASLKSYELLGKKLGYGLVGCDLCGVNAFFIRNDLLGNHFLAPYTAENHYEPLRDFLIHRVGPPRQFTDLD
jgi:hypothetical protein